MKLMLSSSSINGWRGVMAAAATMTAAAAWCAHNQAWRHIVGVAGVVAVFGIMTSSVKPRCRIA